MGEKDDTAIFFGLSGTGKTTLSTDPHRKLIGDDEHGWSDNGVFNFEGGCYAKMIKLSPVAEPEIYSTTVRFGTVLENVTIDATTRKLDLDDSSLTENTRGAYHITAIDNAKLDGLGGHPTNILFLAADAFGVLPPVSRLTPEQAMYHFMSGYTARLAGTEKGVTEPSPVFSACYGAPFMPLHPQRYAELLGKKMREYNSKAWLINTGWTGGPYGEGERMSIAHTRAIVNAVLDGQLNGVATETDPVFGLQVPLECPNVPAEILNPRNTWKEQKKYDRQAQHLAAEFNKNFEKFAEDVSEDILAAAPKVG
jgi:phosphoenolpyruvate carboxykinase (ATP)